MHPTSASAPVSIAAAVTDSPPRAPPIKYTAPLGTRWAKEKAAAGGAAAFDLPTDPKSIGPWILGECVGKGASGRVKIAKHRRTGQLAAVKILPVAPLVSSRASLATHQAKSERQRLGIDREITMMKLMNHPNIMRIYDVYEGEKELFLVLEYVEGGELFDFLVNRGRLPPNEALIYFRQIVYGLNYAHTFSIIHRDLKPENILIASLSPPQLKIADWGMAAFAPPSLQLETSCGSPHYASPEIVNGEKYEGNATDIWSCGVILYALLTGRLPFDDKNVRNLLSKVKSGKYEMPTWIDPQAKDLLSKMLVVDVKQRITIPEILAHPWLTTLPAIAFTDSAGRMHTIHPPPLPPSPTLLGRPIFFPVSKPSSESRTAFPISPTPFNTNSSIHAQFLVQSPPVLDPQPDPELLASLRIIWGRHADPDGDVILRDLCSPPGEGVHAKAFYFLLGRYREERGRYREAGGHPRVGNAGDIIDLETLKFDMGWALEDARTPGVRKYEVPRSAAIAPLSYSSSLSAAHPPVAGTSSTRKRTLTDGNVAHPAGTVTAPHGSTAPAATDTAQANSTAYSGSPARAKLSLSSVSRTGAPRPTPPRRGMTYSTIEGRERGRPGENATHGAGALGFSQHLQQQAQRAKATAVYTSALSPSPPRMGPGETRPARTPLSPILSPNARAQASSPAGMTQSAYQGENRHPGAAGIVSVGSLDLPLMPGAAREERVLRASGLVQSVVQSPASSAHTHGATGAQREGTGSVRVGRDKENQSVDDESWSHVNSDADRSLGVGLGVNVNGGGNVGANLAAGARDMGTDVANVGAAMLELGKSKKEKEKKARPPPLELPSTAHKRSAFAMLGSPIALSSPIHYHPHAPSSANRILASPVVGEFKGWFSNLFNWKHSATHGGLLYSADDVPRTRATVIRVLDALGVAHTNTPTEPALQEHGDILFCRVDHPTADRDTGLALKVVRFRVEFRASSEHAGTVPDDTAPAQSPYFHSTQPATPSLFSTPTTATGSGSRPRASILLGRASSQSTAGTAHGGPISNANGRWEIPPGCACAVALVHEKGSMSTFKTVWRLLKEECAGGLGDAGPGTGGGQAYSFFSPVMPGTPFVESQRMGM